MAKRSMVRCPSCGSPSSSAEEYCRRCGNDLTSPGLLPVLGPGPDDPGERTEVIYPQADQLAGRPAPGGHPRGHHTRARPLIGGLIAVLGLLLVAAGGYTGYRAVQRDARPPGSTTAPTVTAPRTPAPTTPRRAPGPPPLVTTSPALEHRPGTSEVVRLFTKYFTAINEKDYAAFRSTLVDRPGVPQTEDEFLTRYRSTKDSKVRLLGLNAAGEGGYQASVDFFSQQDPEDAPDEQSTCLYWSILYPLVRVNGTLLIDVVNSSAAPHTGCTP